MVKKYIVTDNSLTVPYLTRYLFMPILNYIPRNVSPNSISFFGSICSILSLLFVVLATNRYTSARQLWAFIPAALLVMAFVFADSIDGLHARKTNQSSTLGEFFDHWLDGLSTAAMLIAVIFFFSVDNPWVAGLFVMLGIMAHQFSLWKLWRTQELSLNKIGPMEAALAQAVFYLFTCFTGHPDWLQFKLYPINVATFFLYLALFGFIITNLYYTWQTRKNIIDIIPPVFIQFLLFTWVGLQYPPPILGIVLIGLVGVYINGAIVIARVTEKEFIDWKLPLIIFFGVIAVSMFVLEKSHLYQKYLPWLVILALIYLILSDLVKAVSTLQAMQKQYSKN